MSAKLFSCLDTAVAGNVISQEQADRLKALYRTVRSTTGSDADAKAAVEADIAAEAAEKKRVALLMETKRPELHTELDSFRTHRGEVDQLRAFLRMHDAYAFEGTYIGDIDPASRIGVSAKQLEETIRNQSLARLEALLWEFRKGALTGDARTLAKINIPGVGQVSNPFASRKTVARAKAIVKELRGESSGDPLAKATADIMMIVSDELVRRYNRAGGAIGKLEGWGGPQLHDQRAVMNAGKRHWVDYMMADDMLDRKRMVHHLTGRRLADAELRDMLGVIWERIVSEGHWDREVTGVPTGRGALYKQHAEHRVLHFKSADAWMRYANDYANPDIFHSYIGWVSMMSRDIAHMEKFGPNPNVMRTYLKNHLQSQAAKIRPNMAVIEEQTQDLKDLANQLKQPNPEYQRIADEHAAILRSLERLRGTPDGRHYLNAQQRSAAGTTTSNGRVLGQRETFIEMRRSDRRLDAAAQQFEALYAELHAKQQELLPYQTGDAPLSLEDHVIAAKINALLDDMRQPIAWSPNALDDPKAYAGKMIRRADTVWEHLRGNLMTPTDTRFVNAIERYKRDPTWASMGGIAKGAATAPFSAAGMAFQRTMVGAATLGGAFFSSLTDPVAIGARRSFIGMDWHKANVFAPIWS